LTYAEDIGAVDAHEADAILNESWVTLVAMGQDQARQVEEERPTLRFLTLVLTLITTGHARLLPRDDDGAGLPGHVQLLGWQDEESLFLTPEASYQAVSRFCGDAGEPFAIREYRLRDDLIREGLAEADPRRHTSTAKIAGRSRRVLRLRRA